jgi:hypothetical protein
MWAPALEPCDISGAHLTNAGESSGAISIEVGGCVEEVTKLNRRAWRSDHVANMDDAEDWCRMTAMANYREIITLYSGSQLSLDCGIGECPWGARYWRLTIVFDYPNANVLDVAESQ